MKLTQTTTVDGGDWLVLWKTSQGDYRGVSFTDAVASLQAVLTIGRPEALTQYSAPSATGFSVQITDGDEDVHLILTPAAGYANGTIVLPAVANARDKQQVSVNCTQTLGALVVDGNGATAVTGEPAAFVAANEFFTMQYDLATSTWYRIA